jgi:hypothetical protein
MFDLNSKGQGALLRLKQVSYTQNLEDNTIFTPYPLFLVPEYICTFQYHAGTVAVELQFS